MALTSSQEAVLRAAVTSDASVSSAVAKNDWFTIATVYNTVATTFVWRADVSPNQIQGSIVGSEAVVQGVQQLQLLQTLLQSPTLDATSQRVRQQFGTIFPVSSAASTSANLTSVAQRAATKFEQLFVVSSVTSVYGYVLSPLDVQKAMGF